MTRITLPTCRAHYPGGSRRVPVSIASPLTRPSPFPRRVGIRIFTFEACSGFTRVTARWIAQPPKAAFVTRLRPGQLPDQAARQLPEQSTTLRVEPSSTGDTRRRGARRVEDGRGGLGHAATLRFPSPLIKPDVRISRIRLSDWFHRKAHGGGRVDVVAEQWAMATRPAHDGVRLRRAVKLLQKRPDTQAVFQAHRQSPTSPSKAHQKSGPFPPPALPGLNGRMTLSDSRPARRLAQRGGRHPRRDGSPPITRITFPTCRAHYPGGSSGCLCRLLPRSCGLPRFPGGSASASSLSRPAQASRALRPAGLLNRPRRPLSRGSDPASYPTKPLVSYRTNRQLSGWNPPPLVFRAVGAHCHNRSLCTATDRIAFRLRPAW